MATTKEEKETERKLPHETKRLFISTKLIRPNRFNPRTEIDKESDSELLQSIAVRGVETEIRVRPLEEPDEEGHYYEVFDGDRRLQAAIKAKHATVPIIILSKSDDEVLEYGLVSTIRRGLRGVEMGRTLLELQKRFSSKYPNQRAMARKLGISTARINQYIKLVTDLDPEVQDLVAPADQRGNIPEGAITDRIAYEISHIPDKERQREVAKEIATHPKLTSDRARLLVYEARDEPETPVPELTQRRLEHITPYRPTLVMSAEDYEALKSGKKRVLIERKRKPGMQKDAVVEPLIKAESLELADVFDRPLGRFKDLDAKSAGYPDLESFKEAWLERFGGEWNPQEVVYVLLFK
jgi:ParB/RepB/Spo0J family partition protein